jgi:NADH-quinone oxidoreductase subunit E
MRAKEIADKLGRTPNKLIGALLEYQKDSPNNYLTEQDIKDIAKEMNAPESRIYSLATFYSLLSIAPRGKHIVQLCNDVPCYLNESVNIKEELEKKLNIRMGETTEDGLFTLEFTSCLGYCEQAPAIRIDDKMYGNLTSDKLTDILSLYGGEIK